QLVTEHGTAEDFVGHHTGTENFMVITKLGIGPQLREVLKARITQELESFYNFEERERGHVLIEDGTGGTVQKPLMSAAVEITEGEVDPDAPPVSAAKSASADSADDTTSEKPAPADDASAASSSDPWVDTAEASGDKGDDAGGGANSDPFDW
ncbi:MAG: hypothetical protein K8S97_05335, partial [Anaerolineae bacterium]|nr:hypothetical protein [Anaerolineae bacterium]